MPAARPKMDSIAKVRLRLVEGEVEDIHLKVSEKLDDERFYVFVARATALPLIVAGGISN